MAVCVLERATTSMSLSHEWRLVIVLLPTSGLQHISAGCHMGDAVGRVCATWRLRCVPKSAVCRRDMCCRLLLVRRLVGSKCVGGTRRAPLMQTGLRSRGMRSSGGTSLLPRVTSRASEAHRCIRHL